MLALRKSCTIFSFMKENQEQIAEVTILTKTICRNQHKLVQSFVKTYLAIKIIKCFRYLVHYFRIIVVKKLNKDGMIVKCDSVASKVVEMLFK